MIKLNSFQNLANLKKNKKSLVDVVGPFVFCKMEKIYNNKKTSDIFNHPIFLMLCHWLAKNGDRFLELVQIIYKLVKFFAIKPKSELDSNCDVFCFGNFFAILFERKGIKLRQKIPFLFFIFT